MPLASSSPADLVDRLGCRRGYPIVTGLWSLAAMGHALVHSVLGIQCGAFPAWAWGERELSCRSQGDRRVVSAQRTRTRHRHFQLGGQCRSHFGSPGRAVGRTALWMACFVSHHWILQRDLDRVVVRCVIARLSRPVLPAQPRPLLLEAAPLLAWWSLLALSAGLGIHARASSSPIRCGGSFFSGCRSISIHASSSISRTSGCPGRGLCLLDGRQRLWRMAAARLHASWAWR